MWMFWQNQLIECGILFIGLRNNILAGIYMEVDISSLRLNSLESNQITTVHSDVVSPEDVAWADSCLIKDEISENGCNSHQDTLITRLGSKSNSSTAIWEDISPYDTDMETSQILDARVDDISLSDLEAQNFSGDRLIDENNNISMSTFNLNNVFLPTYNEKLRDLGTKESEDFKFPGLVPEQLTGDIFKVWNLEMPTEEDEFVKQLKKAISESSLELTPPVSDEAERLKRLEDGDIDDIISGIADLSLNFFSI
ncbi:unnamed protein product [Coffea canephora]|uniref:Uncharacterized protein n=2 Tax=Coffea TaxID=13442 RepID=A0A068TLY3_COFCA|nr:unnamed protein product [Coffea canephora]